MKTSIRCNVCCEEIEVSSENKWQEYIRHELLYLKYHQHSKKHHNKSVLKAKGVIKYSFKIAIVLLIWLILLPVNIISYPFWLIFEKINYY